ncbi:MAG: potassium-transporting ATPase subunit KdpB [Gammaproteobacteria bacterium]
MKKNKTCKKSNLNCLRQNLLGTFYKFSPQNQIRNPVMFSVYLSMIIGIIHAIQTQGSFEAQIAFCLIFTVILSNFNEAISETRGKAQAKSLQNSRENIQAKRLSSIEDKEAYEIMPAMDLKVGDLVWVGAGDFIPGDGEVIQGIASVNESALTGESAPVIRESGGDNNSVTGGTQVLSDWIIVRILIQPGQTFLDKIINLVEGSKRQKTPGELSLTVLLSSFTLIFLMVCLSLKVITKAQGFNINLSVMLTLFVCLIPTSIGSLLSAIGISGMNRMIQANVIAMSGRVVELAGDVNTLLLDKTGTITLGNRQAVEFLPVSGINTEALAKIAVLASWKDDTPEGKSILNLAQEKYKIDISNLELDFKNITFIPFSSQTRMSGANLNQKKLRKGAWDATEKYLLELGGNIAKEAVVIIEKISRKGGTPLVVTEDARVLGVIHLKDIIKSGMRDRFIELRKMGIKTMMVTGDNPLTAAAIAAEAGVDDFLANATPEDKLTWIKKFQSQGHIIAMTGDGVNDAPALAQADVAVAMNTGTQAAKEACNLIDLDSDPSKLIDIVKLGKELLITRGALTTFSLANDIAKYFSILPAALVQQYPGIEKLNILHLSNPQNAILSSLIFNALIILVLVPVAIYGVKYKARSLESLLAHNLLVYGLGGLIVPFIGIKGIDLLLNYFKI